MIESVTLAAVVVLGVASLLATYRVVAGPSIPDRVIALDAVFLNGVGIIVLLGVRFGTKLYLDPALIIVLVVFVGTVAVAKFLLRGRAID